MSDPRSPLDRESGNLFDFFLEHVDRAVDGQGAPVSEEGVWYLTSLLVERARTEEAATPDTLVELHLEARQGDRTSAIRAYRNLGDRALYVSGFFRQSLARKLVSRQYYLDMGAAAYDTLADLLRAAGFGSATSLVGQDADGRGGPRGLDDIYGELAAAFEACAEVLGEVCQTVREETRGELSDADILALYEEWQATGSPRIAARLARLGLIPAGALAPGSA